MHQVGTNAMQCLIGELSVQPRIVVVNDHTDWLTQFSFLGLAHIALWKAVPALGRNHEPIRTGMELGMIKIAHDLGLDLQGKG